MLVDITVGKVIKGEKWFSKLRILLFLNSQLFHHVISDDISSNVELLWLIYSLKSFLFSVHFSFSYCLSSEIRLQWAFVHFMSSLLAWITKMFLIYHFDLILSLILFDHMLLFPTPFSIILCLSTTPPHLSSPITSVGNTGPIKVIALLKVLVTISTDLPVTSHKLFIL